MKKTTQPKVSVLASGTNFIVKQMAAGAGDLLPEHLASAESALFVHEGKCILKINDEDVLLQSGEAFAIPPQTRHQIKALTNFKGIHFMPKNIEFRFFS